MQPEPKIKEKENQNLIEFFEENLNYEKLRLTRTDRYSTGYGKQKKHVENLQNSLEKAKNSVHSLAS